MATESASPKREPTPATIPQKRAVEDDHQPAISSPLNPEFRKDDAPRAARAKKESLKKRESKGNSLAEPRVTPDPKSPRKHKDSDSITRPARYKLPPPKALDFEAPRGPTFNPHHTIPGVQFNETSDHVYNKKNFRYTPCIADPAFSSTLYYRQTETEPFIPRFSFEDTAGHMYLDESGKHITTDKGFRMAKANVCVREGRAYWEARVTSGVPKSGSTEPSGSTGGHVRIGWARREATLDAPVGFDAYSYGIRDVAGQKVFMSRPKDFFPAGQQIEEGDVIGLEINLPSEQLHRKVVEGQYNPAVDLEDDEAPAAEAPEIVRDRVPIRFKSHLYFEQIDYLPVKEVEELMNPSPVIASSGGISGIAQKPSPTHPLPALRTLPHSSIKIYKNGVPMGTAFTDLLAFLPPASAPVPQVGARLGLDDGMLGYYPAISVFRGGAAEINLGPEFWFPPPGYEEQKDEVDMIGSDQAVTKNKITAISERYDEQIAEDIVRDIVDEVDFWIMDGGASGQAPDLELAPSMARSDSDPGVMGVIGVTPGEIKELVQDDE